MSLRQLRTRIERLEAKSPAPVNNEELAARERWLGSYLKSLDEALTEQTDREDSRRRRPK